jgi:hypothetical protein
MEHCHDRAMSRYIDNLELPLNSGMDLTFVEQDQPSPVEEGNELPTYDDLAAQNGPNSRFDHAF